MIDQTRKRAREGKSGWVGGKGRKEKQPPISNTGKQATFSKLTLHHYILCGFEEDNLKTKMKRAGKWMREKSKPWDNEIHYCVCAML